MLIRIAEELGTSVNTLLGESVPEHEENEENEIKAIAVKLGLLNEQLAKRNEVRRKTIRIILFIVLGITVGSLLLDLLMYVFFHTSDIHIAENVSYVGGAEAPAYIMISDGSLRVVAPILGYILAAISVVGIYLTKKQ